MAICFLTHIMPLIWITRKTTSNKDCHRLVVKLESVLKYIDSVWKYVPCNCDKNKLPVMCDKPVFADPVT